jgi:hypothetical protein
VLADYARAVVEAGVDEDSVSLAESESSVYARAYRSHDAGPVGAEDARLRHGGKTSADPDVQVIERCRAKPEEHLSGARDRILDVLVAEDFWTAVLMDADRLHGGILTLRFPGATVRP